MRSARLALAYPFLLLFIAACDNGSEENVESQSPAPLATYVADDYYSGNRACAGIGISRLRVSISGDDVTGVSLAESGEPAGEPFPLVFPEGFYIEDRDDALIVVSRDESVALRDGDVILNVGVCPEPSGYFLGFGVEGPWETLKAG